MALSLLTLDEITGFQRLSSGLDGAEPINGMKENGKGRARKEVQEHSCTRARSS